MSTPQPSAALSSSTPSSSPPPNSNASTLLFGFLVSALSIFAVFMTFAIVWNRLIARRHAIDAMLARNPPSDSLRHRRPVMWDIWAVPNKQPPSWLDTEPVAAQKCDCRSSSSQTMQTEQITRFWNHHLLDRLPPEITYLFHPPIPPVPSSSDTHISQVELSHGSDIQVSLLIAMPRIVRSTREGIHDNRHMLHEMVFATTNVHYHDPASS